MNGRVVEDWKSYTLIQTAVFFGHFRVVVRVCRANISVSDRIRLWVVMQGRFE